MKKKILSFLSEYYMFLAAGIAVILFLFYSFHTTEKKEVTKMEEKHEPIVPDVSLSPAPEKPKVASTPGAAPTVPPSIAKSGKEGDKPEKKIVSIQKKKVQNKIKIKGPVAITFHNEETIMKLSELGLLKVGFDIQDGRFLFNMMLTQTTRYSGEIGLPLKKVPAEINRRINIVQGENLENNEVFVLFSELLLDKIEYAKASFKGKTLIITDTGEIKS